MNESERGAGATACNMLKQLLRPAGLVYKHYGREIVASAMQLPADHADVEASRLPGWACLLAAQPHRIAAVPASVCSARHSH